MWLWCVAQDPVMETPNLFLVFYGLNCAVSMALFSLCCRLSSWSSPYSSSFVALETDLSLSLSSSISSTHADPFSPDRFTARRARVDVQLFTNKLTCLSGTNSTGIGILVMYPRLALNSQFSWDWIIHMYHLPGIFLHKDWICFGTVPWWSRWLPN